MTEVLLGKNAQALQHYIHTYIEKFKSEHGGSIEQFDGLESLDFNALLDGVRSISFLEPEKLIVVRNFSQDKELMSRINEVIDSVADSTTLLLVDQNIDKRLTTYKELKKITTVKEFSELNPYELEKWATSKAHELGSRLDSSVARLLVERVGTNQIQIEKELEKLAIANKTIDKKAVLGLVEASPQTKIFDLLDVLFKGDSEKAWRLYLEQRSQGQEPQKIMAMMTWQLQQLVIAKYAPSREALVKSGMSTYSADKSLQLARTISKYDLKHYVRQLAEIDAQTKTSADVTSALELYITDIAVRQTISL